MKISICLTCKLSMLLTITDLTKCFQIGARLKFYHTNNLKHGLKHYQNQDPLSSIHVLIPYMEGIVRKTLNNGLESIDQPTIREKISEDLKGILHTTEDNTLDINAFKSYLKHIWHSSFSNSNNELLVALINRSTVSHGISFKYEEYTMEKALQLILTIDQLGYIYETT